MLAILGVTSAKGLSLKNYANRHCLPCRVEMFEAGGSSLAIFIAISACKLLTHTSCSQVRYRGWGGGVMREEK